MMITEVVNKRVSSRIRYVTPVRQSLVTGVTAELYQQIKEDFMPVPLLMLHSVAPEILAGVWSILRESLLAGETDRTVKEVVAAAVSKNNACDYCLEAHTLLLRSTAGHALADAILRGDYESIDDPNLRSTFKWALTTGNATTIEKRPFDITNVPQVVGTIATFQYINRMVKLFLGDSLLPVPSALKGLTRRVYTATEGKHAIKRLAPGRSLRFVPQVPLPVDLRWASPNSEVASAFAGFASIVEDAGRRTLSQHDRSIVNNYVSAWNGESMGHDYTWVDYAIKGLESPSRAVVRLALEIALSMEVQPQAVDEFRLHYPADSQLIEATAWASFTAARRTAVWVQNRLEQENDK